MRLVLFILSSICCVYAVDAQDDCLRAVELGDISDFCSQGFSNEGASMSGFESPGCWGQDDDQSDVWLTFVPRQQGLLLSFFGSGGNSNETIDGAAFALYTGRCSQLLLEDCERRDNNESDIFERVFTTIEVGTRHYIRISSSANNAGTFQICLNSFSPVPDPSQDCGTGVVLCDKSSFVVSNLEGAGLVTDEAAGSCLDGSSPGIDRDDPTETGSAWYRWSVGTAGSLTFTLIPNSDDTSEDLDFAIFRLPGGLNDCDGKELVRCMASGENGIGGPPDDDCLGPTGLRVGEIDEFEFAGCDAGDNNFLAPLDVQPGETYALIVNNFSQSGLGFSIEWGGTAELQGPDAEFEIVTQDNFECDKAINFQSLSTSSGDPIVSFEWDFGVGANMRRANGEGPFDIVYESIGERLAVLVVESSRGCRVTRIQEINIEPCCDDLIPLELSLEPNPLSCFAAGDGSIIANIVNGNPEFLYSLDQGPQQFENEFTNLPAGIYDIDVIDIKGCEANSTIEVTQPEEILVDVTSLEDLVELGQGTEIMSSFTPSDRPVVYMWTPPNGLSCTDCPNPSVIPPGTTTYTLTVTDEDGCMGSDDITISAEGSKFVIAPNIISLSAQDPTNSTFEVSGNDAVDIVQTLAIYDRWGGQLYRQDNIDIRDGSFIGWNGRLGNTGSKVNPGVYVWLAQVRFIDGDVINFAGDITVID